MNHHCTMSALDGAFKQLGTKAHTIVWDRKIPYFGVKVMWSGTMTAVYRTLDPDRLKKISRITDADSLDKARELAWSRYLGEDNV